MRQGKLINTNNILFLLTFVFIIYQLIYFYFFIDPHVHRIVHLGFALSVVLLAIAARTRHTAVFIIATVFVFISISITVQLVTIYPTVRGSLVLPPIQVTVGTVIVTIMCAVLSWIRFGAIFTVFFMITLVYVFLGGYFLPEGIQPPPVSVMRLITWIGGDLLNDSGVYGEILSLLANYVWLFIIFGTFLQVSGASRFIQSFGTLISGRMASGSAMLSVVSSSLEGTVTGSTVANITMSGAYTIPMMKKAGYTREQAGAIELASSNGGQIMPPIMGIAAFLLANYIGMPYSRLILYAVIPALFYYFCLAMYVEIQARKQHLGRMQAGVNIGALVKDAPLFVLPLLVLTFLMLRGMSLPLAGFWAIATIIVTGLISHSLRQDARINWRGARDSLVSGAVSASEVTIVAALLGGIAAIIEMSGLGIVLGGYLAKAFAGNLFLLLLSAAVVCLILGTGLPTVAAYIITATVLSVPIQQLGVPPLLVHFFIFVYSCYAQVTPPIGAGLLVASKLAGGNYWKTGKEALIATSIMFVFPFMMIYSPALMLQFGNLSAIQVITQFVNAIVLLMVLTVSLNRFGLTKLSLLEMGALVIAGISAVLFMVFPDVGVPLTIAAVVFSAAGLTSNIRRARRLGYQEKRQVEPIELLTKDIVSD
ncbi:MAG: TRAP transporter fused permease subunit [Chloroflexi bacterium]|nr:TRAP transporter fused permease subunit [Chloroflexota bacterium]